MTNVSVKKVASDNVFICIARKVALELSQDVSHPTGAVLVKDNCILGFGWNGNVHHELWGCERKRQKVKTGTKYELCKGCDPFFHAERRAIRNALHSHGKKELLGAECYLWGHYWCCEGCEKALLHAGITTVYVLEDAKVLFTKITPQKAVNG